ncbi:MAG: penicillin-binding protein 2 [Candidatus Hydrogenedentes bacterium]|nr:penicillin-binding protein 2 [Candidatus Hydrogenedentota bacterium]
MENKELQNEINKRIVVLGLFITVVILALISRLWELQVKQGEIYKEKAENNKVWPQILKAERGKILTREGIILADNRTSTDVIFVPGDCPKEKLNEVAKTLNIILNINPDWLSQQVEKFRNEPFTQIIIKRDIPRSDWIKLEENIFRLPGIYTITQPQRRYPYGSTAGQIIGYINEISKEELEINNDYYIGDLIGRAGVEKYYENLLRGTPGWMMITKYAAGLPQLRTDKYGNFVLARRDTRGHFLLEEELYKEEPKPGNDVILTLDIALQSFCENLLSTESGAIVVLEAETGAVLAMASSPRYDPNIFVTKGKDLERLETLKSKPNKMANRAISEHYPPGSVLKIFLAATALEKGVITPTTTFYCPGSFKIDGKGREWLCWQKHGHGSVNVVDAIAYSCDVFFYNVGLKLGIDNISEYAKKIGLGCYTGIDLPIEVPGLIPNKEWKSKVNADKPIWEQRWYPGDTVNLSIGQGSCSTTPLQNAVLMATIINGGYRVYPHVNASYTPPISTERIFSEKTLKTVIQGMQLCVEPIGNKPAGTGKQARVEGITVIGKTGTAQVVSLEVQKKYKSVEDMPKELRDHAWFIAGVIDKKPPIAICIIIEHGAHGSSAAAPLAKEIISFFYSRDRQKTQDSLIAKGRNSEEFTQR